MLPRAPRLRNRRLSSSSKVALALTLVTATVAISACRGAGEQSVAELIRQGDLFLDPSTLEPFSGLAFASFDDPSTDARRLRLAPAYEGPFGEAVAGRRLSSKETFRNGVKHGPYQWYFPGGQLFEQGTYVEGRLDGPYRAYWENGELYEEGTYRRGQFDGPRRWYLEGRLIEVVTYHRGMIDGLYERYLEDGALDLKGELDNGEPCGVWIEGDRAIPYPACGTRVTE